MIAVAPLRAGLFSSFLGKWIVRFASGLVVGSPQLPSGRVGGWPLR